MGGFDTYCYICGIPVNDLRQYFDKKSQCKLSPALLEELRLGYFQTKDGVRHNVKDFDTGGYFTYINTDTNTEEDANVLLDLVD